MKDAAVQTDGAEWDTLGKRGCDELIIRKNEEKMGQSVYDTAIAFIPKAYQQLRACEGNDLLVTVCRDLLIRQYGMKSLAMCHTRALVKCISLSTREDVLRNRKGDWDPTKARLALFATLIGITRNMVPKDRFPFIASEDTKSTARSVKFFLKFMQALFPQKTDDPKPFFMLVHGGWMRGIPREALLESVTRLLPFVSSSALYSDNLRDAIMELNSRENGNEVCVHLESAILKLLPFLSVEDDLCLEESLRTKTVIRLQACYRRRRVLHIKNEPKRRKWEGWFESWDMKIHGVATGMLTFDEFDSIIQLARPEMGCLSEATVMKMYNEWSDRLDSSTTSLTREMSACSIQGMYHRWTETRGSSSANVPPEVRVSQRSISRKIRVAYFFSFGHNNGTVMDGSVFGTVMDGSKFEAQVDDAVRGSNGKGKSAFGHVMVNYGLEEPRLNRVQRTAIQG
mmetsp:Transcript_823/g.1042  ORF Transcript_823/g.1042 Transcript_823/m.1042 type:complete len:455 (-) Transcript_823:107-1471(-)